MAVLQCCVWLLVEMRSSRAVFDLNYRQYGVNRYLRFHKFPKNSEVCRFGCVLFIKPWYHTLHISELKYAPRHDTFPSFLKIYKTAGTYSLQIDDNLSQIQSETNAFLLIVRHNTEGPPIADWQLRHQMLFFFVGLKNRVNLVLLFKPWCQLYIVVSDWSPDHKRFSPYFDLIRNRISRNLNLLILFKSYLNVVNVLVTAHFYFLLSSIRRHQILYT